MDLADAAAKQDLNAVGNGYWRIQRYGMEGAEPSLESERADGLGMDLQLGLDRVGPKRDSG